MGDGYKKYKPFDRIELPDRTWPDKTIDKAPVWCSVDLRDGNQALIDPMSQEEKLYYFQALVEIGFKEIEVGFPSANDTEFEICRTLIEGGHIPDDVTIQVLVQAREHLIRRTFEAIKGAKNVILHFYNSTSTLQRKVVYEKDMEGIVKIATDAAALIRDLSKSGDHGVENLRFQYSPESFTGTEVDNAVWICEEVLDVLGATAEHPVILNLPSTVELSTPNVYADQIEYFIRKLKGRERAIISIHPHNDRGTGVAAAELAMMAGAQRVEGTLFGNGERTGNLDVVTTALNMYTQGVDPELDFGNLPAIRQMYESCTHLPVHQRHPYVGELVFTAFSGSHQDAINKGVAYAQTHRQESWQIPYLPIDPADVGRQYDPIIRINNQSGKGGAAFILQHYGFKMPKAMHADFGAIVTKACDETGKELSAEAVYQLFDKTYLQAQEPYRILSQRIFEDDQQEGKVHFQGVIHSPQGDTKVDGMGNGPIDAFFNAIEPFHIGNFKFVDYSEHAISSGSDSQGVAYIQIEAQEGKRVFGVGMAHNINHAANKAIISAINRALAMKA